jgi:hypothetical protein
MNPVEAAWRKFRNSEHRDLFQRCLKLRQSFLDSIGLKQCPPEVALPLAVPWNLAALDETQRRGQQVGNMLSAATNMLVNTVHVWAAYRQSKTIYEIEPALAQCLGRSPWPAETPAAALRLPSRCPIVTIPRPATEGGPAYVAAVYDLLTGEEQSGRLELRISEFMQAAHWWVPICVLHLNRERLAQCLEAAAIEAERHGAPTGEAGRVWRNELAGLTLTLLLYLAGEPDLVRSVHPGAKPLKAKIARTDPERYRDLAEPTIQAVGKSFARAIERWEIEHASDESVNTGRTMRPHMRRAHSHLYWTGEGRKQPRVRFLLPISIRGWRIVEEPHEPQVSAVR